MDGRSTLRAAGTAREGGSSAAARAQGGDAPLPVVVARKWLCHVGRAWLHHREELGDFGSAAPAKRSDPHHAGIHHMGAAWSAPPRKVDAGEVLPTSEYGAVRCVAYSHDGTFLASGDDYGQLIVWGVESSRRKQLHACRAPVNALAFSPDGAEIVTGDESGTLNLWTWRAGGANARRISWECGGAVHAVAWSPSLPHVASGGDFSGVKVWHATTSAPVCTLPSDTTVHALAYSADGALLASGDAGGAVALWDTHIDDTPARVFDCGSPVLSVVFSPDGAELAAGDAHGRISIWAWRSERALATIRCAAVAVTALAYAPDDPRRLVSGSVDCMIGVWDGTTGAACQSITCRGAVLSLAYAPDASCFASADTAGEVNVWHEGWMVHVARMRAEAHARHVALEKRVTSMLGGAHGAPSCATSSVMSSPATPVYGSSARGTPYRRSISPGSPRSGTEIFAEMARPEEAARSIDYRVRRCKSFEVGISEVM